MVLNMHANLNINKSPFPVSRIPALIQLEDKAEKNAKKTEEYIRNQLQKDITADQLTLREYIDRFTG